MEFSKIQELILKQAEEKGFGVDPKNINIPEKMALIHSEASEAYSAYRHKKIKGKDGFEEELGDIVARVMHVSGVLGINLENVILKKIKKNKKRTWEWKNLNEDHK